MKLLRRILFLLALLPSVGAFSQSSCQGDYTWQINGLTVSFTGSVSSNISNIVWDFGDGNWDYTNQLNIQHAYATPGVYTACIQYYDSNLSCADSACHTFVIDSCFGSFTYTVNGLTVSFQGSESMSTANTVYTWNFGDASGAYSQNPVHTYTQGGIYTVCFAYYDQSTGCADSICMPVTVGGCMNADANFTYAVNGMTVMVTNTSTGSYVEDYWNFGDNSNWYQGTTNPYSYTYSTAGTYWITLGLGDGNLPYACDSDGVYITVPSNSSSCTANFSYIDSLGYAFFINSSTPGPGGSYYWSFGDGNYSNQYNPANYYSSPGTYQVCLVAYDSMQNFCDSTCMMITLANTSTNDLFSANASAVTIAPNPASGSFTLSYYLDHSAEVTISLYDVAGRFVQTLSSQEQIAGQQINQFNTESLNSGTYFIRIEAGGRAINSRLVVTQRN
jgi:PKD repeat protein